MAVTAAYKGHQFRYGFKLGTPSAAIWYWPTLIAEFKTVTPDALTDVNVIIYAADGTTVKLVETAMYDRGDGSFIYKFEPTNTTTWPVGQYQIEHNFVYDGTTTRSARRLMGIYPNVPEPLVTDQDITETISDANDYLGDRTNWSHVIGEAWTDLLQKVSRLRTPDGKELDPYEIADSTELYTLHMKATMERFALELMSAEPDRFGIMAEKWEAKFNTEWEEFSESQISRWTVGPVATDDTIEANLIRGQMSRYGRDGTETDSTVRQVRGKRRYDGRTMF